MRLLGQFIFIYFLYKDILHKKTHELCSNISICLKSRIKHTSTFHSDITPRSIIKHTSNFHLDITPRNIKKKTTFCLNVFICLKQHTSNFHLDITLRSIKNKQLFVQKQLVQDVMNKFSLRYMLKKRQLVLWYLGTLVVGTLVLMRNFCSGISMLKKRQLVQDVINNFRLDVFILRCQAHK